ncbi:MAG: SUMF1/EgtB/PvdO family nonheme iron enzyme [Betaproteobacteria bacterium]
MAGATGQAALPPLNDTQQWLGTPLIRQAGREVLSLALMDARNHTLRLLEVFEQAQGWSDAPSPQSPSVAGLVGRIAWFQERWILRNLQRNLGASCAPDAPRLAPLQPEADAWWEDPNDLSPVSGRPGLTALRADLLQVLESTLDLLALAPETDEGLYFFRLALHHEDLQGERLLQRMQAAGLRPAREWVQACTPRAFAPREPLLLPATRALLGSQGPGFAFDNELPAHSLAVPAFEIDAQLVSWAQFVEFVDDGGYDRQALWQPAGWTWLQALAQDEGRRGPRYVEQLGAAGGAVRQIRFGQAARPAIGQPVMHLSWWEAEAWCRWAGRRLPFEAEWELAALTASGRGFVWGDVWEWTAGGFYPYEGFVSGPDVGYSRGGFGRSKVLRGGSCATPGRLKSPRLRHFAVPEADELFCGFRSCAL